MEIEMPKISFDNKGQVIGEYYGTCPYCNESKNLIYRINEVWVCKACHYKK